MVGIIKARSVPLFKQFNVGTATEIAIYRLCGEFSQITDKTFIVCYERANGTRHCASKEGERFLCCQLKGTGIDVTQEVRTRGTKTLLSWMFFFPLRYMLALAAQWTLLERSDAG